MDIINESESDVLNFVNYIFKQLSCLPEEIYSICVYFCSMKNFCKETGDQYGNYLDSVYYIYGCPRPF